MLRIRLCTVNGLEVWRDIAAGDVDVGLLQECGRPPAAWEGRVVPDRDGEWRTAGWTERPPRGRHTAIVDPAAGPFGGIELHAHPLVAAEVANVLRGKTLSNKSGL